MEEEEERARLELLACAVGSGFASCWPRLRLLVVFFLAAVEGASSAGVSPLTSGCFSSPSSVESAGVEEEERRARLVVGVSLACAVGFGFWVCGPPLRFSTALVLAAVGGAGGAGGAESASVICGGCGSPASVGGAAGVGEVLMTGGEGGGGLEEEDV